MVKLMVKIIDRVPGGKQLKHYLISTSLFNNILLPYLVKERCLQCNTLDTHENFTRISGIVRASINGTFIPYIEYEVSTNQYHFYLPIESIKVIIKALTSNAEQNQYSVIVRNIDLDSNKYEVDGESLAAPESTICISINPKCKCKYGSELLKRWLVQVSFYTDYQDARVLHLRNDLVRVLPAGQKLPADLHDLWKDARVSVTGQEPLQLNRVKFPIDLVYTWVNNEDSRWKEKRDLYKAQNESDGDNQGQLKSAANLARFYNRDELLYSLRSVYMYAPFVRNIYIVTDEQTPEWLETDSNKIKVIFHKDIFDDDTVYPAFSSRPIEFNLHRIDGLSENFLYLNDDFFFCAPANPEDFFFYNGIVKVFPSNRLMDSRKVSIADRPTVVAHKNSAEAFQAYLGVTPTGKFKHAPYAVKRSACYEAEELFKAEIKTAKQNRFRNWNDVAWSQLIPYYMLYKGYAVPAHISAAYIDTQNRHLKTSLTMFAGNSKIKTICINDTDGDRCSDNDNILLDWMKARYPVKPPWEKRSNY